MRGGGGREQFDVRYLTIHTQDGKGGLAVFHPLRLPTRWYKCVCCCTPWKRLHVLAPLRVSLLSCWACGPSCMYWNWQECLRSMSVSVYTILGEKQSICAVFKWATEPCCSRVQVGYIAPQPCCSPICTLRWFPPRQCVTITLDEWSAAILVLHQKWLFQGSHCDTDRLQEKVRQPGKRTGEMMIHHYSKDGNVRRRALLRNALVCDNRWSNQNIVLLDGLDTSQASQFVPSKVAHDIGDLSGSTIFDALFVTSLLLNTRNIWLSLNYEERQAVEVVRLVQ